MISPIPNVLVVTGPGLVADLRLLTEVADREFEALGVSGKVSAVLDVSGLRAALEFPGAVVVIPGPEAEIRSLFHGRSRAVWLDLTKSDAPPAPLGETGDAGDATSATHIHGRGIWGLTWAIRHAVHRLRRPAKRIAYGDHPDQWAEVRLPHDAAETTPVAVLVHGGFWRSIWAADLMDALSIDLAERGSPPGISNIAAPTCTDGTRPPRTSPRGSPWRRGARPARSWRSATRPAGSSCSAPPPTIPGSPSSSRWPECSTWWRATAGT